MLIAVFTGFASDFFTCTEAQKIICCSLLNKAETYFSSHCHAGLSAHDFKCGWQRMSLHKRHTHWHTNTHMHTHTHSLRVENCRENQQGELGCPCICCIFVALYVKLKTNQRDSSTNIHKGKCAKPNLNISSHTDTTQLLLLLLWSFLFSSELHTSASAAFWHSGHTVHPEMTLGTRSVITRGRKGFSFPLGSSGDSHPQGGREMENTEPLSLSLSLCRGCWVVALDGLPLNI